MIDVGSGPPVILIPGIQGRWEWMWPAIDALSLEWGCRVISFSLAGDRGSGSSFDPARGFDNYVDQIEEVMTRAELEDAAVCGVSFGGLIALHWAARRPARTRSLVLVSTPSPSWTPNCRVNWYLRAPRLLSPVFAVQSPFRLGPEIWTALDSVGARLAFTSRHLGRVALSPFSPVRMAERARLMSTVDFEADCGRVTAPTLVVTGEPGLDRVVPVDGTRSYASRIAGARHVTLERTGHIGLVTRPNHFAENVGQFVARASARPDAA
jgi:pimeloyl-ACP methyl ester carboxylesterase